MRGWINRNQYLHEGAGKLFTVPLNKASQNRRIFEIEVSDEPRWRQKFLKSIYFTYQNAPFFKEAYAILESVILESPVAISRMAESSILRTMEYLGIPVKTSRGSEHGYAGLKGKDRIFALCKSLGAGEYVNAIGGTQLYEVQEFRAQGLQLYFINGRLPEYPQFGKTPVKGLSMLDVLMFNDPPTIREYLNLYELIQPSAPEIDAGTPSEALSRPSPS
jgi:hypothetical protein